MCGAAFGLLFCVHGHAAAAESLSTPAVVMGELPPDYLLTPESLVEGKRTFAIFCASCHGDNGWGGACPNLTDNETLHGPRFADMLTVITNGVFATPMPRWVGWLGFERVSRVAAYVYTQKGTRPRGTSYRAPASEPPLRAKDAPRMVRVAETEAPPASGDPGDKPPEALLTPESLAEGKRTFSVHCTSCHGQEGGGGLGPNLTDKDTLHGARYADMVAVITNGVAGPGMPSWINILGAERVAQVAAYVYTLLGTKPPSKSNIRFSIILLAPAARQLR